MLNWCKTTRLMNIFLMGYMASGKTTTGKTLAKKLSMNFVDLDELIEQTEKTTIDLIFKDQGEEKFRAIESIYLKKTTGINNSVIALGGGTPCYNDNLGIILNNGISIYLKMSASSIVNRLLNAKKKRPLIENKTQEELLQFVESSLKEREKFYERANYTINALNLNVEELVNIYHHSSLSL